jgi:hypothetical protein
MDVSCTHCCQKDEINWFIDWVNGEWRIFHMGIVAVLAYESDLGWGVGL